MGQLELTRYFPLPPNTMRTTRATACPGPMRLNELQVHSGYVWLLILQSACQ
jgi:hypothetical protein